MTDAISNRCDLEQKIVCFVNKSHCFEPIRLQGSPCTYFKMDRIKALTLRHTSLANPSRTLPTDFRDPWNFN